MLNNREIYSRETIKKILLTMLILASIGSMIYGIAEYPDEKKRNALWGGVLGVIIAIVIMLHQRSPRRRLRTAQASQPAPPQQPPQTIPLSSEATLIVEDKKEVKTGAPKVRVVSAEHFFPPEPIHAHRESKTKTGVTTNQNKTPDEEEAARSLFDPSGQ